MDDRAFTLLGCLIVGILAGIAGRWCGCRYQLMHRPYDERVKYGPKSDWQRGMGIPSVPKDSWI